MKMDQVCEDLTGYEYKSKIGNYIKTSDLKEYLKEMYKNATPYTFEIIFV